MKRILWATASVGLSSIVVVALGAVRYKLIAVELGAPGVGMLGILTAAASFGVILFSLGMGTSGVQAIAAGIADPFGMERVKAALLVGSRWLAVVGGLTVVLLGLAFGGLILPAGTDPVLVAALGVALSAMVMTGAQLGFLNGIGRVHSLAICNAIGAIVGTGVTAAAVLFSGQAGVVAALAAAPLGTLVCSTWFVSRESRIRPKPTFREWWPEFRGLVAVGSVVTSGLILTGATQLAIRVWIEQTQGLAAAGQFQAAWTITSMYLGFILTTLAVEYFPRISAQVADPPRLNASVDTQARISLMLGGPVLMWMMVLAPFVLHVLFASDFQSAAALLRWQLFGDILKIIGWAIAFLLLARRARGAFFIGELSFNAAYLAVGLPLASQGGLVGFGIAYVVAYALYVLVILVVAYNESGLLLRRTTVVVAVALIGSGGVLLWALESDSRAGFVLAVVIAALTTVGALAALLRMRTAAPRGEDNVSPRV